MVNEIAADPTIIKYLLGGLSFLVVSQIAIIAWLWKKYVRQIDKDHDLLHEIVTEHCVFHRDQTGINRVRN